jgi:hypothetical protein
MPIITTKAIEAKAEIEFLPDKSKSLSSKVNRQVLGTIKTINRRQK